MPPVAQQGLIQFSMPRTYIQLHAPRMTHSTLNCFMVMILIYQNKHKQQAYSCDTRTTCIFMRILSADFGKRVEVIEDEP